MQKHRHGGWLLRQLSGESRTAAEVVMDEALMQDDGIGLIFAELDRCWEVTQDQDKASKIDKALLRDLDGPLRRKQLSCLTSSGENSTFNSCFMRWGPQLAAVIKGYATLTAAARKVVDMTRVWGLTEIASLVEGQNGVDVSEIYSLARLYAEAARLTWTMVQCRLGGPRRSSLGLEHA